MHWCASTPYNSRAAWLIATGTGDQPVPAPRLPGVKAEDKKQAKVVKLVKVELLPINICSTTTGMLMLSVRLDLATIQLTSPACMEIGDKVSLSRRSRSTGQPHPLPLIPIQHQSCANSTVACLVSSRTPRPSLTWVCYTSFPQTSSRQRVGFPDFLYTDVLNCS